VGARRTLLLLHGTGGSAQNLVPLGKSLDPTAALLSPEGKVLENGMRRYFRRHAEGVFDIEDLHARTEDLASFIKAACSKYSLPSEEVIAVGYSNGANIGSSVLLSFPSLLKGAVLLRPMVPFQPTHPVDLSQKAVLLCVGSHDAITGTADPIRLRQLYEDSGASVTVHVHQGGHELAHDDVEAARTWLQLQSSAGEDFFTL